MTISPCLIGFLVAAPAIVAVPARSVPAARVAVSNEHNNAPGTAAAIPAQQPCHIIA
jgi:hypothetical protein